jgi:aspartate-semialdehyde dehydrogenase
MVVALQPLHQAAGIKRVVVSTYQAVSGVGAAAIAELEAQTHAYVAGEEMPLTCFPSRSAEKHYQMLFNVIPQIDVFLDNGYTKEEMKMVNETRKIMHLPELKVTATTVRVPVMRSHSESINVELERSLSVEEARDILSKAPGVKVVDNPKSQEYPMPLDTTKQDDVFVGRIRIDDSVPAGLNLWVVGDQIRKGAALNAIQIAECLL